MASTPLPISNSLATAASLRHPSPLLLNPKSRPYPHLLRPRSSKGVAFTRVPTRKPSSFGVPYRFSSRRGLGFVPFFGNNGGGESSEGEVVDEADAARGQSTLPERFRYLTKEVPDRPVRWPWIIALGFLVYAWRTVLWELGNWKKATLAVISFFSYLSKFVLAFIFRFIGDPLTGLIRCVEFTLYSLRYIYSSIVAFAPVPELTRIILFSSAVLAIAEATVPESVERQQFILSLSGLIAFGAVSGFFLYSYFFRKRDAVSAALPSAAVLVAVGEPWYSKSSEIQRTEVSGSVRKPPVPLQVAALSIGIHVAAKWIRHRHLTWMIAAIQDNWPKNTCGVDICSFRSDAGSLHDRGRTPNLKNTTISMASNTLDSSSARLHAPLTMQ
ncbi:hypothetical protein ACMD2_00633 [Ananas comosus]|uniref:Uncharacterized protein n=1 Tax=Ananas comosus TaxID=4615 RepID=A0A199VDX7_ANACO|nr:hypothetical protein ACMD2_00633 [Ananas comosus]